MFEFPWTRKRRLAEKAEADRIAKLEREKQERRNAQILADQIHRSQLQAKFRSERAGHPVVTPIRPVSGLTAQAAAHDDKRKREEERKSSTSDDSWPTPVMAVSFDDSTPTAPRQTMSGGGGTFDGAGASGDWNSGSGSDSSSSGSSSDSGSGGSGGSSDGGSSSGGSD